MHVRSDSDPLCMHVGSNSDPLCMHVRESRFATCLSNVANLDSPLLCTLDLIRYNIVMHNCESDSPLLCTLDLNSIHCA